LPLGRERAYGKPMPSVDPRQHAPATLRNRQPILDVLRQVLPARGTVLEVASGTGEHAVHFARAFANLVWQPSDPSPDARESIEAWAKAEALVSVRPPLDLDTASVEWPIDHADAIVCINMVHISPWEATEGLMRGAGQLLPTSAPLVLYGPYRREDLALEPSNEAFDADLRRRNPAWGLRLLEHVVACARKQVLRLEEVVEMPANNLTVIFRKG
jgi:SAM-dependent methyltransferase